jgi:hypothetical protein
MPRRIMSAEAAAAAALRDMPSAVWPLPGASGTEGSSDPSPLLADRAPRTLLTRKTSGKVSASRCYFFEPAERTETTRWRAALT